MGSMAAWFGGTTREKEKGAQPYVDAINNWAQGLNPSLGVAGKTAKRGLRALESGDYDKNPALSGYFAPIRDMYATSVREGSRNASMGVGAKWGQDNPVLAQRVSQLNEERAREGEGQAMTRMIPELYNSFSNTFENARSGYRAEEAMQGQGLQSALQAYLSQFYNKQHGGILPAIAQMAQGAGSMMGGFGAMGGAKPPVPGGGGN
jgi:hypothetical protein